MERRVEAARAWTRIPAGLVLLALALRLVGVPLHLARHDHVGEPGHLHAHGHHEHAARHAHGDQDPTRPADGGDPDHDPHPVADHLGDLVGPAVPGDPPAPLLGPSDAGPALTGTLPALASHPGTPPGAPRAPPPGDTQASRAPPILA